MATTYTPEVTLTKKQLTSIDAAKAYELLENRMSIEHAKVLIPSLVASGRIKVPASVIPSWTYGRITIKEVVFTGGKKVADKTFTEAEFAKLTSAEVAELLTGRISPEKSKGIVLALIQNGVVKPSPEDLVRWSYNRIAVEGIKPEWSHGNGPGASKSVISVAGVVGA